MMIEDGPWPQGINSGLDPLLVPQGAYQWSVNTINRGGRIQTRPSYRIMSPEFETEDNITGQGGALFSLTDGTPVIVVARGGLIYYRPYPFYPTSWAFSGTDWKQIQELKFRSDVPIHMEVAVKATDTDAEGNVSVIDSPYSVLMISDGSTRTGYWDGLTARHLNPTISAALSETPVCSWMKWIGNRLWVAVGKKIIASDLLNPLKFLETQAVSGGGYFVLPDNCTGLGTTVDFKKLLAFTDNTTTSIQAGISDRTEWVKTPEFQAVIFPSIGCAAGRTIINQYGLTQWLSHGGWMGLDVAVSTYRTSKIHYRDSNMARSKYNLSPNISGACAAAHENFVLVSVPSGHITNAHTWVMDQGVVDTMDQLSPPAWASVWTGISPVQYITGVVHGQLRCFAVGYKHGHVWELFGSEDFDIAIVQPFSQILPVPIRASVETRLLGNSETEKLFDYAEIELDEIPAPAHITVSYAGKNSCYKVILDNYIVATTDSLNHDDTFEDTSTLDRYLAQKRIIRTESDDLDDSDPTPGVETSSTRNKDRAFSLLISWTGRIAISKLRFNVNDQGGEMAGRCEDDELTDRYIKPSGQGAILQTIPSPYPFFSLTPSLKLVTTVTPRYSEEIYEL